MPRRTRVFLRACLLRVVFEVSERGFKRGEDMDGQGLFFESPRIIVLPYFYYSYRTYVSARARATVGRTVCGHCLKIVDSRAAISKVYGACIGLGDFWFRYRVCCVQATWVYRPLFTGYTDLTYKYRSNIAFFRISRKRVRTKLSIDPNIEDRK